jgi:hypothetical protein
VSRREQTRRLGLCVLVIAAAAYPKNAFCQGFFDYVPNQPYTAEFVSTHLEASADGTSVPRKGRQVYMRDSQGRTRIESCAPDIPCAHFDGNPLGDLRGIVNLYVPLRRQFIQLLTWQKTARVMTFPGAGPIPTHGPNLNAIRTTTESLPGKTIHGVYAVGTRTTEVLPADDRTGPDIVNVQEEWISPDLNITVQGSFTSTDPRSSNSSSEIQKLDRGEPDPALFEIPADYKIETVSVPQADSAAGSTNTEQRAKQP